MNFKVSELSGQVKTFNQNMYIYNYYYFEYRIPKIYLQFPQHQININQKAIILFKSMDFWLYDMILFDSNGNSVIDSNQFNISSISHCISFLFYLF